MSFFAELKRRNVVRVGIAYAVASWIILQATDVIGEILDLPQWGGKLILLMLAVGFVLALFFAWAYELTPEGLKRESEVDRSQSVAPRTGRKLDFAIIALLAVGLVYFIYEARFMDRSTQPAAAERASESAPPAAPPAAPDTPAEEPSRIDPDAIAVLPFANRSLREEDQFFTDGIHDDLLTQLAKISGLRVISRTSVMEYRDTTRKIPEIAADLGVGKILEGGVQRAGDRVRINAQLIDVATDQHLWAETFDREMTIDNIFDIQSEITRQIVTAVKGEFTEAEERSLGERPTDSLAAWEAFTRAQAILRETDYENSKYARAEPLVRLALEADPEFAEAWVLLAEIQLQGIWGGFNNTQAQRELARQTVDRARALSPGNPFVLAAEAEYEYRVNLDYARSLELIDQSIALAPGDTRFHHHRGLTLRRLGRWEEAIETFDRGLELDPLDSYTAATKAETLTLMKDWARLDPLLDHWLQIAPNSYDLLNWKVSLLIGRDGDLDAAREVLAGADFTDGTRLLGAFTTVAMFSRDWEQLIEIESSPENEAFMAVADQTRDFRLGRVYALKGEKETAEPYLRKYLSHAGSSDSQGRVARSLQALNQAEAHMWLGEKDQASRFARLAAEIMPPELDALWGALVEGRELRVIAWAGEREEALQRIAGLLGRPSDLDRWRLYLDPTWDFFRDDPRFNELVRPEGVEPEPFRTQRLGDGT